MAEEEVDYSQVPFPDRFQHKNWKIRKEGYEAAAKAFEQTPDDSDPVFRDFVQDPGLWKGACADSNVAAQAEGLAALCAFLKYGPTQGASRSRPQTIPPIYEKGLTQTRPAAKASALEALLLYVEVDKPDSVIEDLMPALAHKQPKVIAATLAAITSIYHNFGVKIVDYKPMLKALPKIYGHADKNVRAEGQNLTVELYRWLKDAMKTILFAADDVKDVQKKELETKFEKVREEPAPKQERFTRVQQEKMAAAAAAPPPPAGGDDVYDEGGEEQEEPAELDTYDMAEPVDVYKQLPDDFQEKISSSKWKDRKEILDALFQIANTPRIKEGPYDEVMRALAKSMKDANVAVVTVAANCIEKLALGLRKAFAKYRATVLSPIMERLKEKKQSVADALGAALDAVFTATSLSDNLGEILSFLTNKNPQVKGETIKFLGRCLRTTKVVPSKDEQKQIADAGRQLLTESTEAMRAGGAEILGVLMKIIGERAMTPYISDLDDIRKTKIKEYFDTAEVKAKEKPKPAAAPAKAAPGAKKLPPGKRPVTKKVAPPPEPEEDAAPLKPKPTAKSAARPGVAKPGLAQPSGLKLGGLKRPGAPAVAASPQRRVISPPVANISDDEAPQPSPSKFGMGRGGLTGRSLAKPAAAPASPPYQAPVSNGLSSAERGELDELRLENERLLAHNENLKSSNSRLNQELTELQIKHAELLEDHTRDTLQIKAKETQLVRARGECEVLRSEVESAKRESDRYKREVSRLGRESIGRERDDLMRGRNQFDDINDAYENGSRTQSQQPLNGSRPGSAALQRTGSTASSSSRTAPPPRPQSTFSVTSPAEEKENNLPDIASATALRRKITSPVGGMAPGRSPQRPQSTMQRNDSTASNGESGENWKRAAEVTNQLKARIEAMKARQGLTKPSY